MESALNGMLVVEGPSFLSNLLAGSMGLFYNFNIIIKNNG